MLLEKIGYVVEIVSIFGRTTPVVHAVVNCYTPTIIQTYDTPSFFCLYHHLLGNFLIACGMNALPVALPKPGATESVAAERVFLRAPLGS